MTEEIAVIVFGDGLEAYCYDEKNPKMNRYNKMVRELLVVPSRDIREKFNIPLDDLNIETSDGTKGRWEPYPDEMVLWINRTKKHGKIIVFCAYDGSDTEMTRHGDRLFVKIEELEKEIAIKDATISRLFLDLEDAAANIPKLMQPYKEVATLLNETNIIEQDDDANE